MGEGNEEEWWKEGRGRRINRGSGEVIGVVERKGKREGEGKS